ncbi:hypothetical protein OIU80_06730 [Flavobacterium sp. LS1R47]|uniref:Uncharacterized protein n=1 Tax=Flavobacterium frigoritolerans TaxID=2987686 RepID=A0A9X2ZQH2_9FLAO|nr:hypothetical protein [Flavobacterium frigoritolerans]MCV9931973.1 hypothetical protein [Flavobacterium frigoritolerans]
MSIRTANVQGFLYSKIITIMNAKNTPATSYDPEKLIEFFNKDVPPESMAKIIRNLNYVIALTLIRKNETLEHHTKELDHGLYWLNQLAEILNPHLTID